VSTLTSLRWIPLTDLLSRSVAFVRLFGSHLRVHWVAYAALAALWMVVVDNYRVGFNQTPSLPQSVFLIHKNEPASKGQYVAFRVPPEASKHFSNPNAILTKIVVGVEGDRVSVADRIVHVNGVPVGYAKPKSLKGEPLFPLNEVVIPYGHLYVMGLHKDSLDSRYTIVGLVPVTSVVGRAHPLF